ncbi:MAG: DNA-directed RNA polymerase subunit omega [Hymenobacter sp.]
MYEAISVISKRANQLSVKLKEELTDRLAEFATTVDNLEEVFENREQIEVQQAVRAPCPSPPARPLRNSLTASCTTKPLRPRRCVIPRELF